MGDAAGAKTFYTDRKPYPGPSEAEEGVTYIAEDVLDATTDFLPFFGMNEKQNLVRLDSRSWSHWFTTLYLLWVEYEQPLCKLF